MISFARLLVYNLDRDGGANLPKLQIATIDPHARKDFQLHLNALDVFRTKSVDNQNEEEKQF